MKLSIKYIYTALCCITATFLSILYFYVLIFNINDFISTSFLCKLLTLITLTTFFSVYLLKKNTTIKFAKKYMWYFLFIIYLMFLGYLLFFSRNFLRLGLTVENLDEYISYLQTTWKHGVNLTPFSSIDDMITVYNDYAYGDYSFVNLFGNLIAFMPFAFFMKVIDKNLSHFKFFMIVSCIVALVEILQFLSGTGAMDIDDFILNVTGSVILYSILNIPILNNIIKRLR